MTKNNFLQSPLRLLLALLLFTISVSEARAWEKRDLLQSQATEAQVRSWVVADHSWIPYPAYTDRAGWDAIFDRYQSQVVKEGEKYLGFDWVVVKATQYLEYEKSGSRNIMQDPLNKNIRAFSSLLAAELAEGKGRFMGDLINGVLFFSEMSSWAESAHLAAYQKTRRAIPDNREQILELSQGGTSQMMAWTWYFLHKEFDKWDPSISIRLRHELQIRELDPYLQRYDFWWMAHNNKGERLVNNWNPWCNSNALLCFMILEDNPDTLAKAVWKSMQSVDSYLNYVKGDGACEEGPSYWDHAPGKLLAYLEALKMITGGHVDLFGNKLVRDMGEYICRSYIGDGWVVNFADASARAGGMDYALIYRYGCDTGSQAMTSFAATQNRQHHQSVPTNWQDFYLQMENLRAFKLMDADATVYKAPTESWYPETEFYYCRKGNAFLATKGGFNDESHNHNDVGTFTLAVGNVPLFIDAGVGTYTRQTFSSERYKIWTMQSLYHNLPAINGVAENYGRKYKATNVSCKPAKGFFSLDIAKAYPESAGVKTWQRTLSFSKSALLITDRFQLAETKAPNVENFLTWGRVDISRPGVVTVEAKGKKATLTYDASLFTATLQEVPLPDKRLSNVWGPQVYRVSLTAKSQSSQGTYKIKITY